MWNIKTYDSKIIQFGNTNKSQYNIDYEKNTIDNIRTDITKKLNVLYFRPIDMIINFYCKVTIIAEKYNLLEQEQLGFLSKKIHTPKSYNDNIEYNKQNLIPFNTNNDIKYNTPYTFDMIHIMSKQPKIVDYPAYEDKLVLRFDNYEITQIVLVNKDEKLLNFYKSYINSSYIYIII